MKENLPNELKEVRLKQIPGVPFFCETPLKEFEDVADLLTDDLKEKGRERLLVFNIGRSLCAVDFWELPIDEKGHNTFFIPEIFCRQMLSVIDAWSAIAILHKHADDSLEMDEYDNGIEDEVFKVAECLGIGFLDYMLFNSRGDVYSDRKGQIIRIKGKKTGREEMEYDGEKEISIK